MFDTPTPFSLEGAHVYNPFDDMVIDEEEFEAVEIEVIPQPGVLPSTTVAIVEDTLKVPSIESPCALSEDEVKRYWKNLPLDELCSFL